MEGEITVENGITNGLTYEGCYVSVPVEVSSTTQKPFNIHVEAILQEQGNSFICYSKQSAIGLQLLSLIHILSASDLQNVELFNTGINSGVGIRTTKGNTAVCKSIPTDEKIINLFESVQGNTNYCFVYTENSAKGKIYSFDINTQSVTLLKDNMTVTGPVSYTHLDVYKRQIRSQASLDNKNLI